MPITMQVSIQVKIKMMKNLSDEFLLLCCQHGVNPMDLNYVFDCICGGKMYFKAIVPDVSIKRCEECKEPSRCSNDFKEYTTRLTGSDSRILCDSCACRLFDQVFYERVIVSNYTFIDIEDLSDAECPRG